MAENGSYLGRWVYLRFLAPRADRTGFLASLVLLRLLIMLRHSVGSWHLLPTTLSFRALRTPQLGATIGNLRCSFLTLIELRLRPRSVDLSSVWGGSACAPPGAS